MAIHLYTVCWNEEKMLPFLFRHYDSWVDRYVIFDDGSTDGSIDILKAHPRVELRQFQRVAPDNFDKSKVALQNKVWEESRGNADWVIMIDVDEHLFVPGVSMLDFLDSYRTQGVTFVPALGYQMISEDFPEPEEHLCHTRTWGAPWYEMSKPSIFNPDAIEETNFRGGRHFADPVGRIILPERDELLLLHYKYMGIDRTYERYQSQLNHIGEEQKAHKLKTRNRYTWPRKKLHKELDQTKKRAVDISRPDLNPWKSHKEIRWWRQRWRFRMHRKFNVLKNIAARKLANLFTPVKT